MRSIDVRRWLCVALFVPAALLAQETELAGTWEISEPQDGGTLEGRVVLAVSGDASVLLQATMPGQLGDEAGEIPEGVLPETLVLTVSGAGTWSADADSLRLLVDGWTLEAQNKPFREFIDETGEALARALAEELELPDEELADFIALVQASLHEEIDEETLLAGLTATFQEAIAYELDGDELRMEDGDEPAVWRRVQQTAVVAASWGQIKQEMTSWNR